LPRPSGEWRPGILALADRARLDALVADAGFSSTTIEAVDMAWRFADANDYWRFLVDLTALGPLVRSLPDAAREAVRAAIDERLTHFARDGEIALPSRCWCGVLVR
jgi:hypothetical protein